MVFGILISFILDFINQDNQTFSITEQYFINNNNPNSFFQKLCNNLIKYDLLEVNHFSKNKAVNLSPILQMLQGLNIAKYTSEIFRICKIMSCEKQNMLIEFKC